MILINNLEEKKEVLKEFQKCELVEGYRREKKKVKKKIWFKFPAGGYYAIIFSSLYTLLIN